MKNPEKNSGLFGFWQNIGSMFSRPRNTAMAYAIALGGLLGGLTGCDKDSDPAKPDPVNPPAAKEISLDLWGVNRLSGDETNNMSGTPSLNGSSAYVYLRSSSEQTTLKLEDETKPPYSHIKGAGNGTFDIYAAPGTKIGEYKGTEKVRTFTMKDGSYFLLNAAGLSAKDTTAAKEALWNTLKNAKNDKFSSAFVP